eukprot:TRINITY_DN50766_c0_g1_i1.p1 TRINITY_DN50766_c0_g1~~TRINITY_DN50766_c0_g1_i1.p1  ORF type:complete len:368 (+),score=77.02 TRINITY_DN50766_c0_g1_i1:38-1141(+)
MPFSELADFVWQWREGPKERWQWSSWEVSSALSEATSTADCNDVVVFWPPYGDVTVDLGAGCARWNNEDGQFMEVEIRKVPSWWGDDANLAAGVLVGCSDAETVSEDSLVHTRLLLAVETRPWWSTCQSGPLWGFVDPPDRDLAAAMARECEEEALGVAGSAAQIGECLRNEDLSAPVCRSPWHRGPRGSEGLEVLRLVSLGRLTTRERESVIKAFSGRRNRALAAAAAIAAGAAGVAVSPAPHLEVERLFWVDAKWLSHELKAGRSPWLDGDSGPLRGFAAELVREGLSSRVGRRFQRFCQGDAEVISTMPHSKQLLRRLCSEASLGRGPAFTIGRYATRRQAIRGHCPKWRCSECKNSWFWFGSG